LERALIKLGIPYNLYRGTALMDHAVVMDVLAYMRLMVNPRDDPSVTRIFNKPSRRLGKLLTHSGLPESYMPDNFAPTSQSSWHVPDNAASRRVHSHGSIGSVTRLTHTPLDCHAAH